MVSSKINLLVIQPTPFCNINCDYCYLTNRLSKRVMSSEVLEHIFKHLFDSKFIDNNVTIVWHAGEPLVVPPSFYANAFKIIDQLNTSKVVVSHSIQTNATLLTSQWCTFILKNKMRIGVSLDGPAYIHDLHRKTRSGSGTHSKVMQGISLLQQHNIEFHVIAVLTWQSLNYPDEMFEFFLNFGITRVGFNIDEIEGANTSSSFTQEATDDRYRNFMRQFMFRVKQSNNAIVVREFEGLRHLILSSEPSLNLVQSNQSSPFSILSVDCEGNFTTFSPELLDVKSEIYGDFILGNVLSNSFDSITSSPKFRKINEDIHAGIEICKQECEYFSLCGGGAPVNKYFENGTFRSSETLYCRYTKKSLIDLSLEDAEASILRL